MQRQLKNLRRSEVEEVKDAGLHLDWDEIARKGKMSAGEKQIAKWYGVYGSRQEGAHMARIVVPGGRVTSRQARALATVAERYAQGTVNVTTRQALQLHWVKLPNLPDVMRELRRGDLSTFHGSGDVSRNVAACPWASVCKHRRLDVLPDAKETAEYLTGARDLDNLPRKFKVSFSGCQAACGQAYMNCVGAIAIVRRRPDGTEQTGYRLVIGGGMGHTAFVAQELYSFVPQERIKDVTRAVAILFRDHGDRYNRAHSRLKYVVKRYGIDRCRELVDEALDAEGVSREGIEWAPSGQGGAEDCGPPVPARPLTEPDPIGTDGGAIQQIMVPKGELSFRQLRTLADLSEVFGDKHLYTTNRQNVELHGVPPARLPLLREEIRKLGFAIEGFFGLEDVVTCVGTKHCPFAVGRTHHLFDLLQSVVHQERFAGIREAAIINITGCPNSCSPYRIADIGFRGMRIREQAGSVGGYEIVIGGTQQAHGRRIGDFKEEDCVRVTVAVLETFLHLRDGEETLSDNVQRLGTAPYDEAVARLGIEYDLAEAPAETSVFTGLGTTALDAKTIARDIPCQDACPAKTHVPTYIERIAAGAHEDAYRINQEDNVFPGALGRICARPCEDSCRHNWTGTEGPVQICHLKRAAADRAPAPEPLPPWFPDSGLRVGIVGGGPAGLTAARELRRYGHDVTVYEKERELGGLMQFGIPTFRLPRDVVRAEVKAIVDSGIHVRTGVTVDRDRMEALHDEYDALLVTAGAMRPLRLELDGIPDELALSGLDFMRAFNSGAPVPIEAPVLVIGGGFTAVDCVRAARRVLGPDGGPVTMVYRRNEDYMAANREELHTIAEEGITLETLATPLRGRTEGGRLAGVVFERNLLGPAANGDKPRLKPVPGTEFELPARTVIYAIGQTRTLEILPYDVEQTGGEGAGAHRTTRQKLFVAGDFGLGSLDVIHAVADAKAAADAIDEYLVGDRRRDKAVSFELAADQVLGTGRVRDMDIVRPPDIPLLVPALRTRDAEVELGLADDQVQAAAERCYTCDYKYEIDQDRCIHCDWCIRVAPRDCIHRVSALFQGPVGEVTNHIDAATPQDGTFIWIDSDECIRCGQCLRACPTGAISVRRTEIVPVPRLELRPLRPAAR